MAMAVDAQQKKKAAKAMLKYATGKHWDPSDCPDWKPQDYSMSCLSRTILKDPPPGIVVIPDKSDMTQLHALITGPDDTPYEGGIFRFFIRCPPNYPIHPPRVKLLTTGNGVVRFNPNLYSNGKVCLSILGTWEGPGWVASMGLASLLISIQSLLNDEPLHNEPGLEKESLSPIGRPEVEKYNAYLVHETLRVAVCDTVEMCLAGSLNLEIQEVVYEYFMNMFDHYVATAEKNKCKDGQLLENFLVACGMCMKKTDKFNFASLRLRLNSLKSQILARGLCQEPSTASCLNLMEYYIHV
ncbi:unnamed protein product [Notodromas monacha]|uniref:Ubiquitin-conjugating enzyme E2 Z n=1 Tax=Notodromas monacha TaxID=399045 RepID=A0A7R9BD09_9CRUS|nr:unnamed protein product [Notodromas monacha]CAG0913048.1 unnamed protein product [Notodromas monacha]